MPTFGRTGIGKWHIAGPDGCRYGRAFSDDDDEDQQPDETATAADIVAYDQSDQGADGTGDAVAFGSFADPLLGRGRTDAQRLVLPTPIRQSDADLCTSCRSTLETHQQRRSRVIASLKRTTPHRDIDWQPTENERNSLQCCYWCRAHESTLWMHEALDSAVCPACGRLFNTPLGDPGPDTTRVPIVDRRRRLPLSPRSFSEQPSLTTIPRR